MAGVVPGYLKITTWAQKDPAGAPENLAEPMGTKNARPDHENHARGTISRTVPQQYHLDTNEAGATKNNPDMDNHSWAPTMTPKASKTYWTPTKCRGR